MTYSPDSMLLRKAAAAALTDAGFPTAEATLATKATRGGGPPFRVFGRKPMYRYSDLIQWAESRSSRTVNKASEVNLEERMTAFGQHIADTTHLRNAFVDDDENNRNVFFTRNLMVEGITRAASKCFPDIDEAGIEAIVLIALRTFDARLVELAEQGNGGGRS